MRTFLCVLALVGSLGIVSACGGGGGGGSPAGSVFTGPYRVFLYTATAVPTVSTESAWGVIEADGLGGMTGSLDGNVDTALAPATPMVGWTTRVESDLSFAWQFATAPGTDVFTGSIRADGKAGALTVTESGGRPGLLLVSRPGGVYGLPLLNDVYHACGFAYHNTTGAAASYYGTMTFDGTGGGERSLRVNRDGMLAIPLIPLTLTYTLSAEGSVAIDDGGLGALRGGVFDGGDLVIVGGSAVPSRAPLILAMVQPSTTALQTLLHGTYAIAGIQRDVTTGDFFSQGGTAVADGAGTLTVTMTENREGVIVARPAEVVAYTVAPDGKLVVTPSGGEPFRGGVSPTGDYAVLGGADAAGADPGFYVLVRQ